MTIRPSPCLATVLLSFHLAAAIVVYLTEMPLPGRLALLAVVLSSLVYYLMRDAFLLLPDSWCELSLERDGVTFTTRNGIKHVGGQLDRAYVSPCFTVLRIRLEGSLFAVSRIVPADAMVEADYRILRVHLKYSDQP